MARTVEIDEADLQRMQLQREFLDKIWNNPKAKRKLMEAQREVRPDDPMIKELDKPDPIEERFTALANKNAELEKKLADDKAEREQNEKLLQLKKVRDDGMAQLRRDGWTDKGLEDVDKLMQDKGILDPLDAAAIWEKANPPQNLLTPNHTGSWNFLENNPDENADLKKLIETKGESNPLLDKMTHDALREIRGSRPTR
jgi:hypothetical protein